MLYSRESAGPLSDLDRRHALMDQARARADELRDEALQAAWEAVGDSLRRLWIPVGSWLARRARARADAAMWQDALSDVRVRQELAAIRDHAESMAEAAARACQIPALRPSLIVQPMPRRACRAIDARQPARSSRAVPVTRVLATG